MKRVIQAILVGGVFGFVLAGCNVAPAQAPSYKKDAQTVEQNQQKMMAAVPIPILENSNERHQLAKRAIRLNAANINGCVTLFSDGVTVAQYNIAGKVTSLNSFMAAGEKFISDPNASMENHASIFVEQPDIDGGYGENANGVFFFEASTDAYVEWRGDYIFTDQCLKVVGSPLLIREAK